MIKVYSDIHNEIRRYYKQPNWVPPVSDLDKETTLILAGDIDLAKHIPKYLNELASRFKYVIHVAGNHEYYGSNLVSANKRMKENLAPNVFQLQDEELYLEGQHFFGGTMWTDLSDPQVEYDAAEYMNDYKRIRLGGSSYRCITPSDTTRLHGAFMQKLEKVITKDTIVISHHNPLQPVHLAELGRQTQPIDYAYCAGLDDFILQHKPKVWACGHTHQNFDTDWFGTRLISNCLGYYGEENEL